MKNYLLIGAFLLFKFTTFAQHKNNVWTRATIDYEIKNTKFKLDNEFQFRLQDNSNHDVLTHKLLLSYRNWWYFQPSKKIKVAVSPFAYFKYYKSIFTAKDELSKPKNEIRFSGFIELQNKIFQKSTVSNRFFTEYRLLTTDSKEIVRYRNRLGFLTPISKNLNIFLNDEVFLNINQPHNFFDQNRIIAQLNCKISKDQKIETGYIFCNKNQTNSFDYIENNLFINYTFEIR